MFSYDARAIQGYDKSWDGNHFEPGNSHPNMDDGDQNSATVFFGVPNDTAVTLNYERSVDAISAVFMHEYTMNEYNIQPGLNAASEWVMTFPTKHWYVDEATLDDGGTYWIPDTKMRSAVMAGIRAKTSRRWSGDGDKPDGLGTVHLHRN